MYNNDYMYAIERNDEYLAHYGIRGMKWGVRKAIASGNSKRLGKQYAKAQRKLAKLQKRATSGKKYAKRAALLGAGAAAAGGLAAVGAGGVSSGLRYAGRTVRGGMKGLGNAMDAVGRNLSGRRGLAGKAGNAIGAAGRSIRRASKGVNLTGASHAVDEWARSTSMSSGARKFLNSDRVQNLGRSYHGVGGQAVRNAGAATGKAASDVSKKLKGVSNNTIARIGAGAVGAGLGVAAGYNAYRAATTKRAAKKAAQFQSEMNKAFAGTQYANGGNRQGKKRKRR